MFTYATQWRGSLEASANQLDQCHLFCVFANKTAALWQKEHCTARQRSLLSQAYARAKVVLLIACGSLELGCNDRMHCHQWVDVEDHNRRNPLDAIPCIAAKPAGGTMPCPDACAPTRCALGSTPVDVICATAIFGFSCWHVSAAMATADRDLQHAASGAAPPRQWIADLQRIDVTKLLCFETAESCQDILYQSSCKCQSVCKLPCKFAQVMQLATGHGLETVERAADTSHLQVATACFGRQSIVGSSRLLIRPRWHL